MLPGTKIGKRSKVGLGSIVIKDVTQNITVLWNPYVSRFIMAEIWLRKFL